MSRSILIPVLAFFFGACEAQPDDDVCYYWADLKHGYSYAIFPSLLAKQRDEKTRLIDVGLLQEAPFGLYEAQFIAGDCDYLNEHLDEFYLSMFAIVQIKKAEYMAFHDLIYDID